MPKKPKEKTYRVMEYLDAHDQVIGWAFLEPKEYERWLKYSRAEQETAICQAYFVVTGLEQAAEWGTAHASRLVNFFHESTGLPPRSQAFTTAQMQEQFVMAADHPLFEDRQKLTEAGRQSGAAVWAPWPEFYPVVLALQYAEADFFASVEMAKVAGQKGQPLFYLLISQQLPAGNPPSRNRQELGPFFTLADFFSYLSQLPWQDYDIVKIDPDFAFELKAVILSHDKVTANAETCRRWSEKFEQSLQPEKKKSEKLQTEKLFEMMADGGSLTFFQMSESGAQGRTFYYYTTNESALYDLLNEEDQAWLSPDQEEPESQADGPFASLAEMFDRVVYNYWYQLIPGDLNLKYRQLVEKEVMAFLVSKKCDEYVKKWQKFFTKPQQNPLDYWLSEEH